MNVQDIFAVYPHADTLSVEQKWNLIKARRRELLTECDWTQIPDAALTLEEKAAWSEYRQALRDLPQDFENPDDVVFPSAPGGA